MTAIRLGQRVPTLLMGTGEGLVHGIASGAAQVAREGTHLAEEGVDLVEDAIGAHRRVWWEPGHAEIEMRSIDDPRAGALRRRVKQALEQLDSVRWTEVNAITGRVAVGFDEATPVGAIVGVVEAIEERFGVRQQRLDERLRTAPWETGDRADHPADIEPVHRAVAALIGDAISLGAAVAGRVTRFPRLPLEIASLLGLLDFEPRLHDLAERLLGRRALELLLPQLNAVSSGIAQGPAGILVDMAYRTALIGELQARRRAWERRSHEFYAAEFDGVVEPPALQERPVPLPEGPVEAWSERLAMAGLGGFGTTLAATGDLRRSADVLLAGIPKAARLGREGFATQLGRILAARGTVPLDASALRRLDRIDTVVLDSATLLTGRAEITRAVSLGNHDTGELLRRADTLLDPERPERRRSRGGWTLVALDDLKHGVAVPRGAKARARELRSRGTVPLALVRRERVEGVVAATAELDPGAHVVVDSVRRAGHRLVVAGRNGRVDRLVEADARIPAGRGMGAAIRAMQADGAVVAAVVRRGTTGLAAADVGINVQRRTGRPSWGGDLLCCPDLVEAAFILDASVVAAQVSRRSARFAIAGSGLGALVASTGPRADAGSRGLAMVNGAGAASLAAGAWAATSLGRKPRPVSVDRTPWHALDVGEAMVKLESRPEGLSAEEAADRRHATRPTETDASPMEPFLEEIANPLTPVLGAGAGLSAAVGSMVDAGLVVGLIGLNAVVGGVQRVRTGRALGDLLRSTANEAHVIRDGEEVLVTEEDLVRGDVIVLRAGDAVPADCRIIDGDGLEVDESTLTGESLPVSKSAAACEADAVADRASMLYQDTTVAAGEGMAVVVAVGAETEVARTVAETDGAALTGGVEARLEALTRRILPGAVAAALGVAGAGLLRRWQPREMVGTGVSLAVASVPEGLPFLATAAQTASARRLSARNALVRDPRSIEALGRVDVLCFDKTGTLTEGRLRLLQISDGADILESGPGRARVLGAALRATPSPRSGNGVVDPVDAALWEAARAEGVDAAQGVGSWRHARTLPFEPSRGLHAALGRSRGRHRLSVKGAPEVVLPRCRSWRRGGRRLQFSPANRRTIEAEVARLATRGFRVLAVAERVASQRTELDDRRVNDLELCGLLALSDPVRDTAAEAVAGVRAAGVETVMVTGDHPGTAEAIAERLGMLNGRRVVTGAGIDAIDDAELDALVGEVGVFARVSPAQKVRIVRSLQRTGRTVAMTGDGANDAASIRLADVGVALGTRGTPAARDAADVIVVDDRIETIIDALVEGRALWGSVREALGILVGGNIGEIAFTVGASLFSRHPPMNPRQFLLINLVTDLAPAMAVAVRPPADTTPERLLREGPDVSLAEALNRDIAIRAAATAGGATAAWLAARGTGTRGRASTVALTTLVGCQLGQTLLSGGARSPLVLATSLGSAALTAGIVQTPGVSGFFGCRPLGPVGWAQAGAATFVATGGSFVAGRVMAGRG